MDVRDFDFDLPSELIAQEPLTERGGSRLLSLNRATGAIIHTSIAALPEFLRAGDVLVINNTRVFPARLIGRRVPSGGAVECLLIGRTLREPDEWEALVHPGQKLKPGAQVVFEGARHAARRNPRAPVSWPAIDSVVDRRRSLSVDEVVDAIGHVPLPPYIKRGDRRRRSRSLPDDLRAVTRLGCRADGRPAFQPGARCRLRRSRRGDRRDHAPCRLRHVSTRARRARRRSPGGAGALRDRPRRQRRRSTNALRERRRIVAVGTTTTRTLEAVAREHDGRIVAWHGMDRPVHLSWLCFSCRIRAADELSSASIVAADAGVGLRRPRARAGRVPHARSPALSVLQLWRRHADACESRWTFQARRLALKSRVPAGVAQVVRAGVS